jgi:hypothetical protein
LPGVAIDLWCAGAALPRLAVPFYGQNMCCQDIFLFFIIRERLAAAISRLSEHRLGVDFDPYGYIAHRKDVSFKVAVISS